MEYALLGCIIFTLGAQSLQVINQPVIDYIGQYLNVQYRVVDNTEKYGDEFFEAVVTLRNSGKDEIQPGNWRIYFTSVQVIEPEFIRKGREYVDPVTNLSISHEKGYLFSFGPSLDFLGLPAGHTLELTIKAQSWSASRYEQMPNWYVAAPGLEPATIQSTEGESLNFVAPFSEPQQFKRMKDDRFSPWTPAARYDRNKKWDVKSSEAGAPIIPLPVTYTSTGSSGFPLCDDTVSIVLSNEEVRPIADYFIKTMKTVLKNASIAITNTPSYGNTIIFKTGDLSQYSNSSEAYRVQVNGAVNSVGRRIIVTGASSVGVFHGAVSLIHLAFKGTEKCVIDECEIIDWPRLPYRGMFVDTARNFLPKCAILNLLDVMALYKLNKFHIHLTDDEGWRIEIKDLPELTQIGGRRCHDPEETECIMSTLGSGPDNSTSGSGFYTENDYREILMFAAERNIEVIPEIDMPGHAHSAIRAMRARTKSLRDLGLTEEAEKYALDEEGDGSRYFSVQFYTDNAVNPCLESTYRFIQKILTELQRMHEDIQPLKKYHFGGDEVAHGAWLNSTACQDFVRKGVNLKKMFSRRVSELTKNLTLVAWEDGLMAHDNKPWDRNLLANKEVIANTWNNIWEWGGGSRSYILANNGYKVVLSSATHLYFDQPQEPSPEERGFYWATRYTDTFKTFSFMPDDFYLNADIKRSGEKITLDEICGKDKNGCPPLKEGKRENIIGIQGQLWSETVRQPYEFQYMVFPRLLALAERAWHKAPWEGKSTEERRQGLNNDWSRFAQSLGSHDLSLMDLLNVDYRVPAPGAKQRDNKIVANVEFPGLTIEYKIHGKESWSIFDPDLTFTEGQQVSLRTSTSTGKRQSKEIVLHIRKYTIINSEAPVLCFFPFMTILFVLFTLIVSNKN